MCSAKIKSRLYSGRFVPTTFSPGCSNPGKWPLYTVKAFFKDCCPLVGLVVARAPENLKLDGN